MAFVFSQEPFSKPLRVCRCGGGAGVTDEQHIGKHYEKLEMKGVDAVYAKPYNSAWCLTLH